MKQKTLILSTVMMVLLAGSLQAKDDKSQDLVLKPLKPLKPLTNPAFSLKGKKSGKYLVRKSADDLEEMLDDVELKNEKMLRKMEEKKKKYQEALKKLEEKKRLKLAKAKEKKEKLLKDYIAKKKKKKKKKNLKKRMLQLEIEMIELKEKLTDLNNTLAPIKEDKSRKNWGKSLYHGLFMSMYGNEFASGLEVGWGITPNFLLRVEIPVALGQVDTEHMLVLPSIGILGRSSLIGNMRFYGGFSLGILLDVFFERTFQGYKTDPNGNTYKDYDYKAPEFGFVNFKGMVGLEYYASRHVGFFLEFGGTTLFGGKDSPVSKRYDTKGLYSSVGTRFYFW